MKVTDMDTMQNVAIILLAVCIVIMARRTR